MRLSCTDSIQLVSGTDVMVMAQVSVSSLNRHAVATRKDVGMSKALCLKVNQLPMQIACLRQ